MFCSNCGKQVPDGNAFCDGCGAPMTPQTGMTPPVYQPGYPPQPMGYDPTPFQQGMLTPAQQAVKSVGSSAAYLVSVILATILFGFSVVSAFSGYQTPLSILISLLAMIPGLLMIIGLWMSYASSTNPSPTISGLGLCRGVLIFYIVVLSIGIVAVLIIGIISIVRLNQVAGYYRYSADSETAVLIASFAVGLLVLILALLYFIKAAQACRITRETMLSGVARGRISSYITVINIIIVVFSTIGLIVSIVAQSIQQEYLYELQYMLIDVGLEDIPLSVGQTGFVSILRTILTIAELILFSVTISQIKKRLAQTTYPTYYQPY